MNNREVELEDRPHARKNSNPHMLDPNNSVGEAKVLG